MARRFLTIMERNDAAALGAVSMGCGFTSCTNSRLCGILMSGMAEHFDALLVLSFGGPERPEDVMPFLENVTRGRGVPRERLLEVAENYAGWAA
jgi:hypothetical protein